MRWGPTTNWSSIRQTSGRCSISSKEKWIIFHPSRSEKYPIKRVAESLAVHVFNVTLKTVALELKRPYGGRKAKSRNCDLQFRSVNFVFRMKVVKISE